MNITNKTNTTIILTIINIFLLGGFLFYFMFDVSIRNSHLLFQKAGVQIRNKKTPPIRWGFS